MTPVSYKIWFTDNTWAPVKGYTSFQFKGLAVRRVKPGHWVIDHMPSGLNLGPQFKTRNKAAFVAAVASETISFDVPREQLNRNAHKALQAALNTPYQKDYVQTVSVSLAERTFRQLHPGIPEDFWKKKRKRKPSYRQQVRRVLKQLHPKLNPDACPYPDWDYEACMEWEQDRREATIDSEAALATSVDELFRTLGVVSKRPEYGKPLWWPGRGSHIDVPSKIFGVKTYPTLVRARVEDSRKNEAGRLVFDLVWVAPWRKPGLGSKVKNVLDLELMLAHTKARQGKDSPYFGRKVYHKDVLAFQEMLRAEGLVEPWE